MENSKNVFDVTEFGACPGSDRDQTVFFQSALDACRYAGGGTVTVPDGCFFISGIRMWDDTTLHLSAKTVLLGSTCCDDYPIYPIPEGVELRTDQELLSPDVPYPLANWRTYRRAMISAYGVSNVAVIGEKGSVIDGRDCFDPDGDEGFHGPHGIFLTNCKNVTLHGYTIQNTGSFMHQLDNCRNIEMTEVTALAGHDGVHLHFCQDMRIENCVFRSGDDCISGANAQRVHVRGCELNTACNIFRIGGSHWLIEDCHMKAPGIYPHRLSIVKDRDHILPPEQGRKNTLFLFEYFCSTVHPPEGPTSDWTIRNCTIDGVERILHYEANRGIYAGAALTGIKFENVTFTDLFPDPFMVILEPDAPIHLRFENVSATGRDGKKIVWADCTVPYLMIEE